MSSQKKQKKKRPLPFSSSGYSFSHHSWLSSSSEDSDDDLLTRALCNSRTTKPTSTAQSDPPRVSHLSSSGALSTHDSSFQRATSLDKRSESPEKNQEIDSELPQEEEDDNDKDDDDSSVDTQELVRRLGSSLRQFKEKKREREQKVADTTNATTTNTTTTGIHAPSFQSNKSHSLDNSMYKLQPPNDVTTIHNSSNNDNNNNDDDTDVLPQQQRQQVYNHETEDADNEDFNDTNSDNNLNNDDDEASVDTNELVRRINGSKPAVPPPLPKKTTTTTPCPVPSTLSLPLQTAAHQPQQTTAQAPPSFPVCSHPQQQQQQQQQSVCSNARPEMEDFFLPDDDDDSDDSSLSSQEEEREAPPANSPETRAIHNNNNNNNNNNHPNPNIPLPVVTRDVVGPQHSIHVSSTATKTTTTTRRPPAPPPASQQVPSRRITNPYHPEYNAEDGRLDASRDFPNKTFSHLQNPEPAKTQAVQQTNTTATSVATAGPVAAAFQTEQSEPLNDRWMDLDIDALGEAAFMGTDPASLAKRPPPQQQRQPAQRPTLPQDVVDLTEDITETESNVHVRYGLRTPAPCFQPGKLKSSIEKNRAQILGQDEIQTYSDTEEDGLAFGFAPSPHPTGVHASTLSAQFHDAEHDDMYAPPHSSEPTNAFSRPRAAPLPAPWLSTRDSNNNNRSNNDQVPATKRRKLRNPVTSNTSFAASAVMRPGSSRQPPPPSHSWSSANQNHDNGPAPNLWNNQPSGGMISMQRNDLSGGSGVGAGNYQVFSGRHNSNRASSNPLDTYDDDDEENGWLNASTTTKKKGRGKGGRGRGRGRGGKRKGGWKGRGRGRGRGRGSAAPTNAWSDYGPSNQWTSRSPNDSSQLGHVGGAELSF